MTKNAQKWPKYMIFGLFKKILSLVLSRICVNESPSDSLTFCENCMLGKNLVSQVIAKIGSGPMRFQYSLIVNISLID